MYAWRRLSTGKSIKDHGVERQPGSITFKLFSREGIDVRVLSARPSRELRDCARSMNSERKSCAMTYAVPADGLFHYKRLMNSSTFITCAVETERITDQGFPVGSD
jgi:hypothetical protein